MTKTEAEQLAKGKTLVELYEIIRLSADYEANAENDLVVRVVDAEIRSRTGNDHPVGLASLLAPRSPTHTHTHSKTPPALGHDRLVGFRLSVPSRALSPVMR